MTEPTYSISSEFKPDSDRDTLPWLATATRLSDDRELIAWGSTREDAIEGVRSKIRAGHADAQVSRFYADEDGNPLDAPTPEPQSLDAHRADAFCCNCREDFAVIYPTPRMGALTPLAQVPSRRLRERFASWADHSEGAFLCGNCYYDLTDDDV